MQKSWQWRLGTRLAGWCSLLVVNGTSAYCDVKQLVIMYVLNTGLLLSDYKYIFMSFILATSPGLIKQLSLS